ncbi:MAG: TRAP transporter substrate-binding protein [Deltaproteobacteria bacterium]|nr:TRAP transporter substrate-binding protein [Deltaproteobacteria bacterium]MBW2051295.1 TRAP transporter substrate-binding protein [Deltaproteobacteria bacterium]MBW2141340.1 TRAP transporter substrate-binding protein [Deltaproteobacteria bacterium]MBW2323784.1 TRAP transporter substrate-binding protein [Deltaproteobacteria bacterium]
MRKIFFLSTLILLMACFLFSGFGQGSALAASKQKNYELSFTSNYMDKHPTVRNAFIPWAKEVENLSQGRLKITYFNPNTLAPAKDAYDSTLNGVLDIGACYCGFNPGKFPVSDVMELPLIVPGAEAGSLVTWDLYNKFPEWQAQYKDVKMLWQWSSATYQIHTTKKLIQKPSDLKGLKIIGWSPILLEILKALGANPMHISPTDTYLALQRGMADGVVCPLAPVRSYKISDATKYHTIIDLNVGPFWAGINKDLWNDLPADLKKILDETTGVKMARASGKTLDDGAAEDAQWMKSKGHKFYVVPEQDKKEWYAKIEYMHQDWVKKMEAKGCKNAQAILDEAVRLGKEYAKTTGRGYVD